ncbi:MAG: cytidine deaminase [Flavobacteriales bacterium]|jgi:cytidine deaminase|tara:strand:+ start:1595 stop:2071 length:477 start_codon:yes stop_codon:yes gene_type:complete
MNKKSLNIEYLEYDSVKLMNSEERDLITQADENLKNAYAPYSKFKVSAVCQMENGVVVKGANQENGAYPSGLCAERVAIFSAKSQFPDKKVDKIVVTTELTTTSPVSPCGACRQVLIEYELTQNQPIELIMKSGDSKVWKFKSVKDILPFAFDGEFLK